jgi:hypothetical protein
MDKTSSRAGGPSKHHPAWNAGAWSFLLNCSALRGNGKPRSLASTGESPVEGPRRGSSNYHGFRASHNRRALSNALPRKGLPPWSFLFVGAFVSTPAVAKFFSSVSTATAGRFAVARCVGITTGGLNAMRPTAITKTRAKAERLMPSVKKSTANVSAWLEVRPR